MRMSHSVQQVCQLVSDKHPRVYVNEYRPEQQDI